MRFIFAYLILLPIFLVFGCSGDVDHSDALPSCESIDDVFVSYLCFRDVALINNDFGICDMLDSNRTDCYVHLILNMGLSFDRSICDDIGVDNVVDMEKCIGAVAYVNNDISSCDIITTRDIRDDCNSNLAVKNNDWTLCDLVDDVDGCYLHIAYRNNNSFVCDLMSDISDRDYCLASVINDSKNYDLCDKISDLYLRDECYLESILFNDSLNDVSLSRCYEFSSWAKYECLTSLIFSVKDIDICENILDDDIMLTDFCYYSLAGNNGDIRICEKISDDARIFDRDSCINNIEIIIRSLDDALLFSKAVETNDSSICGSIINSYELMDECFYAVAVQSLDYSICNNIGVGSFRDYSRDKCFAEIAYKKKDFSICFGLLDADSSCDFETGFCVVEKDICLRIFASKIANSEKEII